MTDSEIESWWEEIGKAADNAPKSPYSHAKVNDLVRAAWKLKHQLAEKEAECERLKQYGLEALEEWSHAEAELQSALWRVSPNVHTVSCEINNFEIPDPFEGPGETYKAAYERLSKLVVHCENCGSDYAATGIEAGCPCRIQAKLDNAVELLRRWYSCNDEAPDSISGVKMRKHINRFLSETCGQDLVEYALLLTFLTLAAIGILPILSEAINGVFNKTASTLNTGTGGGGTPQP